MRSLEVNLLNHESQSVVSEHEAKPLYKFAQVVTAVEHMVGICMYLEYNGGSFK